MLNFNNLLSALQQAKNSATSNVGKAVNQTQGYFSRAKDLLKNVVVNPQWKPQPEKRNIPSAMQESFDQATKDFSPAAMRRAKNIRINITPLKGDPKFGNVLSIPNKHTAPTEFGPLSSLGGMPARAAGLYNGSSGRGEISVDPQYMSDMPSILRHELIHSMDAGVNFGRPTSFPDQLSGPEGEPNQQELEESIARDNELTKKISILQEYLTGMGIIDSNNFYQSVNPNIQENIRYRTSGPLYSWNGSVHPKTLDREGLAYVGESGPLGYTLPQYKSMIDQSKEYLFPVQGTVVLNRGRQRLQLKTLKEIFKKK